jgi:hypothetical protein
MATGFVVDTEWLDGNRLRRYPFMDDASMTADTGGIRLSDSLLVDCALAFPFIADMEDAVASIHVKYAVVTKNSVILTFYADTDILFVATLGTGARNTVYQVAVTDGVFAGATGTLVAGDVDAAIKEMPPGHYTFGVDATRLVPTCIRPALQGVTSLKTVYGGMESRRLYGDVELVAGQNVFFEVDTDSNSIIVNSVPTRTAVDCDCVNLPAFGVPIRTIHGVKPDSTGNVELLGDACLEIEAKNDIHAVQLNSPCATPCCDCEETLVMRQDLDVLFQRATTMQSLVDAFRERLVTMEGVIGAVNTL